MLAGFQDEVVHAVRPAMLVLQGAVIGAGAGQLLRQFLAEGLLLSMTAAAAGLLLAEGGLRFLAATGAGDIPGADEIGIDWRVLLFSLGLALATGLVFGLAPILHARPASVYETLKSAAGRTASSPAANRFRFALVSSELALALILLIGSGLMVKAFWRLQQVDSGLNPGQLLTMQVSLPPNSYGTVAPANAFWSALIARAGALPGAESAAIARGLPPSRPVKRQYRADRKSSRGARRTCARCGLLEFRRREFISARPVCA